MTRRACGHDYYPCGCPQPADNDYHADPRTVATAAVHAKRAGSNDVTLLESATAAAFFVEQFESRWGLDATLTLLADLTAAYRKRR
jgi:hypothetical protein